MTIIYPITSWYGKLNERISGKKSVYAVLMYQSPKPYVGECQLRNDRDHSKDFFLLTCIFSYNIDIKLGIWLNGQFIHLSYLETEGLWSN